MSCALVCPVLRETFAEIELNYIEPSPCRRQHPPALCFDSALVADKIGANFGAPGTWSSQPCNRVRVSIRWLLLAPAGYGGIDPAQDNAFYLDSGWTMGTFMRELAAGYDCPLNAAYLDVTTLNMNGPSPGTSLNAICIFELQTGEPVIALPLVGLPARRPEQHGQVAADSGSTGATVEWLLVYVGRDASAMHCATRAIADGTRHCQARFSAGHCNTRSMLPTLAARLSLTPPLLP